VSEAPELWISKQLVEGIRGHGAESYPYECCGALLGRDHSFLLGLDMDVDVRKVPREVLALLPLVNRRDDSPCNRFSVSAKDVLAAEKAAGEQSLDLIGWYHSHPDHPAHPSDYDREHAWPWYSYIIVSVQAGAPAEMTSWRLADDRSGFAPEMIEMMRDAAA
jgi:proteasome lid subunit RPN8/RPN11